MNTLRKNANFVQVPVANKCLALVLVEEQTAGQKSGRTKDGQKIFDDFRRENRLSYWNPNLVDSINSIEYVGFVKPSTLFVTGQENFLECMKNAWIKRVLKAPSGMSIRSLGDVGGIEMQEVPQTQFIPLPEVLCSTVTSLNRTGRPATIGNVTESLRLEYPNITIPKQNLLTKTLHGLMAEGKIFFMKGHYFAPSVAMLQQYRNAYSQGGFDSVGIFVEPRLNNQTTTIPQQMSTKECQTGTSVFNDIGPYNPQYKKNQATCANLKKPITKESPIENQKLNCKKEKHKMPWTSSLLAKIFRRSQSKEPNKVNTEKPDEKKRPTLATFNTQFPPPEWQCNVDYANKPNKGRVKSDPRNNVGSTECSKGTDAKFVAPMPNNRPNYFSAKNYNQLRSSPDRYLVRKSSANHYHHRSKGKLRRHSINYDSGSEYVDFIMNYERSSYGYQKNNGKCHKRAQEKRSYLDDRRFELNLHTIDDGDGDDDEQCSKRTSTPTSDQVLHQASFTRDFLTNRFIDQLTPPPPMRKPTMNDEKLINMTKNENNSDHNRDSAISSNSPRLSSGGEENYSSSSPPPSKNCSISNKENYGRKKCALGNPVADHTYMNIVDEDGQILFVESNNPQNRDLSHTYENLSKFLLCSQFAESTARFDKLSLSDFSATYSDHSRKMALTRSFSSL